MKLAYIWYLLAVISLFLIFCNRMTSTPARFHILFRLCSKCHETDLIKPQLASCVTLWLHPKIVISDKFADLWMNLMSVLMTVRRMSPLKKWWKWWKGRTQELTWCTSSQSDKSLHQYKMPRAQNTCRNLPARTEANNKCVSQPMRLKQTMLFTCAGDSQFDTSAEWARLIRQHRAGSSTRICKTEHPCKWRGSATQLMVVTSMVCVQRRTYASGSVNNTPQNACSLNVCLLIQHSCYSHGHVNDLQ